MPAPKDITGMKFGKLTAVEWTGRSAKNHGRLWLCLCECGNETEVPVSSLVSNNTTSCGCHQIVSAKTHGLSSTSEWNSWRGAKDRCLNSNSKDYCRYGKIGITFFEDWVDDFEAFLSHIGFKPKDGNQYSLGRIDNTLGYIPGNVRWETPVEQCRNRSRSARNTTGVVGISDYVTNKNGKDYKYVVASWQVGVSKQETAYYSVNTLGYEKAFELAVERRNKEVLAAEVCGVVFAETHGKSKVREVINDS